MRISRSHLSVEFNIIYNDQLQTIKCEEKKWMHRWSDQQSCNGLKRELLSKIYCKFKHLAGFALQLKHVCWIKFNIENDRTFWFPSQNPNKKNRNWALVDCNCYRCLPSPSVTRFDSYSYRSIDWLKVLHQKQQKFILTSNTCNCIKI